MPMMTPETSTMAPTIRNRHPAPSQARRIFGRSLRRTGRPKQVSSTALRFKFGGRVIAHKRRGEPTDSPRLMNPADHQFRSVKSGGRKTGGVGKPPGSRTTLAASPGPVKPFLDASGPSSAGVRSGPPSGGFSTAPRRPLASPRISPPRTVCFFLFRTERSNKFVEACHYSTYD